MRLVEVSEDTTDPAAWGVNWPREYDDYQRTAEIDAHALRRIARRCRRRRRRPIPWLTRMFAGYAFAIDYRDRRGHAYMLQDQEATRRVTERPQPGSCLQCHTSVIPTYRRLGGGDVFKGFEALGKLSYARSACRGREDRIVEPRRRADRTAFEHVEGAHPVSCVDCHDPTEHGAARHAAGLHPRHPGAGGGPAPVPHLESIERWRAAHARRRTIPTWTPRARRCARSSAASATSSTTAGRRRRCSIHGTTA